MFGKLDVLTALIAILGVGAITVGVTVASSTPIVPTPMTNSGGSGNMHAQPIHGQVNVCNRSPMMAAWLVSRTGATSCATLGHYALGDILGTVDLDERMIATLQSGDFAGLWNINNIDLSENSLTAFDSSWIALEDGFYYHDLDFIDLSDNSITSVSDADFSALLNAGFRTIDFSDNNLTAFPHATAYEAPPVTSVASQFPVFEKIDFSDNNIMAKGPDGAFGNSIDVAEIDVSGNSSLCWDDGDDIVHWLLGSRYGGQPPRIFSPLNLRVLNLGGTQSSGSDAITLGELNTVVKDGGVHPFPLLSQGGYTAPTPKGSRCDDEPEPTPTPTPAPSGGISDIVFSYCQTGINVGWTLDGVAGQLWLAINEVNGQGRTFIRDEGSSNTARLTPGDTAGGVSVPVFTTTSAEVRGVNPLTTEYTIAIQNTDTRTFQLGRELTSEIQQSALPCP